MTPPKIVFPLLLLIAAAAPLHADDEVKWTETLPLVYINTENQVPVTSKIDYLNATFRLDPMGDETIEPMGTRKEPLPMQIRGRGHSSWKGDKKPYKLKFPAKESIMGMPANKHWALIKPTEFMVAGFELGRLLGMPWTPNYRPVEVMLNGRFIGMYFLTETVRINKNRVNIYEQPDKTTDPELIKGGWLVEIDNYRDLNQITIPEHPKWNMTLRYHSPENLSTQQLQWLTDEFMAINRTVYATDKRSTDWEEFIDLESMARFFIIQEIMDNPDGFHGSMYLYKDLGDNAKWTAGPLWDMNCYYRDKTDYTFNLKVHYAITPHWIGELIQYDSFCKEVASQWAEIYPDRLNEIYDRIDSIMLPLETAWINDCILWNDPVNGAEARADKIKTALAGNIEWFGEHVPVSPWSSQNTTEASGRGHTARVYNLQGILVGEYETVDEAINRLNSGLYIINGKKFRIR